MVLNIDPIKMCSLGALSEYAKCGQSSTNIKIYLKSLFYFLDTVFLVPSPLFLCCFIADIMLRPNLIIMYTICKCCKRKKKSTSCIVLYALYILR
jgi:hypothetical protein